MKIIKIALIILLCFNAILLNAASAPPVILGVSDEIVLLRHTKLGALSKESTIEEVFEAIGAVIDQEGVSFDLIARCLKLQGVNVRSPRCYAPWGFCLPFCSHDWTPYQRALFILKNRKVMEILECAGALDEPEEFQIDEEGDVHEEGDDDDEHDPFLEFAGLAGACGIQ